MVFGTRDTIVIYKILFSRKIRRVVHLLHLLIHSLMQFSWKTWEQAVVMILDDDGESTPNSRSVQIEQITFSMLSKLIKIISRWTEIATVTSQIDAEIWLEPETCLSWLPISASICVTIDRSDFLIFLLECLSSLKHQILHRSLQVNRSLIQDEPIRRARDELQWIL